MKRENMNSTIKNKNNEHTAQSFNRVWNDYGKKIFYYMRQIIPSKSEYFEDYFQEIMLKVFKEIQNNNIKKSLTTWIYRITRNYCIDILRKSDIPEVPLETKQGSERYSPEKIYKKNTEKQAIGSALEKLSAVYPYLYGRLFQHTSVFPGE